MALARHDVADVDLTPKAMAETDAIRSADTPVRNNLAWVGRCAKLDGERELFSWENGARASIGKRGDVKLRGADGAGRVDVAHVVTSNMLHTSPSRPSDLAAVAESPSLFKDVLRWPDGTVNNRVANKLGTQIVRHHMLLLLLLGGLVDRFLNDSLIRHLSVLVNHRLRRCGARRRRE